MVALNQLRVQLINKPTSAHTGIGRYAVEIERGLRAEGVDLRLAALKNPLPRIARATGRRAGYDLDAFLKTYPLRADVRRGHITHLTSQTLGLLLLAQRLPRPVVITVHDILPYLLRNDPELQVYRTSAQRLMDSLAMRGLKRADRLIADSTYTRATMMEALDIAGERIDVAHLGIDRERFQPQPIPESFRDHYNLPDGRPYLLYVGSEDPRKQLASLIEALARVRQEQPDTVLLKVGAAAFDEQRQQHLHLCQELGVSNAVRWFDDVPEEVLPLFYNAATVFAFPSLYEGFGFPVLEALACGTPVVAMNASSIPELVGDAAALVSDRTPEALAQALISTITNQSVDRSRMRAQANRFSWTATTRLTTDAYSLALQPGRSRTSIRPFQLDVGEDGAEPS